MVFPTLEKINRDVLTRIPQARTTIAVYAADSLKASECVCFIKKPPLRAYKLNSNSTILSQKSIARRIENSIFL